MVVSTPLERLLLPSVTLAAIRRRVLFLAAEIRDEADEREEAGDEDEAIRCWARDARELAEMLERFEREELRALLEGRP